MNRVWSRIEVAPPSVRGDQENDDTILAALIDVACHAFWLGLTEAPGLGGYYLRPIR